jgi:hypothetical protein
MQKGQIAISPLAFSSVSHHAIKQGRVPRCGTQAQAGRLAQQVQVWTDRQIRRF